jgi:hypothetical protein
MLNQVVSPTLTRPDVWLPPSSVPTAGPARVAGDDARSEVTDGDPGTSQIKPCTSEDTGGVKCPCVALLGLNQSSSCQKLLRQEGPSDFRLPFAAMRSLRECDILTVASTNVREARMWQARERILCRAARAERFKLLTAGRRARPKAFEGCAMWWRRQATGMSSVGKTGPFFRPLSAGIGFSAFAPTRRCYPARCSMSENSVALGELRRLGRIRCGT